MKPKLIVLTGATASGKTSTSIALATRLETEIISADSMQVYKGMDIGTAKITQEEMQGIKHHLIDILEPDQEFNITIFQTYAKEAMREIYRKGKIPIIVGGTGFYIQSLVYDTEFDMQAGKSTIRKELEIECEKYGIEPIYQRLQKLDPVSASTIHMNNKKRVIRALEYILTTGEKISTHNQIQKSKSSPYDIHYYVLNMDRAKLYQRIEMRVDQMLEKGLIEEVQGLLEKGYHKDLVSMQGLGYKEIIQYLDGEISLEEAIYILKRDTRHFAKRQLTWFRREKLCHWLNMEDFSTTWEIIDYIQKDYNKT